MSKKYITTAIPYANAKPHIGTAMDYLYGDILARFWEQQGDEILMSVGTDEHGTKVAQKAADMNTTPQQYVDDLQVDFQKMREELNIDMSFVRDVRTTSPEHKKRVQEIWKRLDAAELIYKSTYEGWYCSGCEAFLTETEARDMDYVCKDHNKPLEKLSEENYYLKVSDYSDQIREFVKTAILPEFRAKEILELTKDGVRDVSISRPKDKLNWGIPVPGDDSQVMYVWIDALSNYITALEYPDENWDSEYWPAKVEIVGKDILRFHAIIWPAILLGLGLELPQTILVHGFINVDGKKMSKSVGNVISPSEIITKYGTDAFRYYFSRHISVFDDGDFTWEKFEAAYNGELANDLGNLVSRLANMIKKYDVKRLGVTEIKENQELKLEIENFNINKAMEIIWSRIQKANKTIEESKPWELAKTDEKALSLVLNELWDEMLIIVYELKPFMPQTSAKINEVFGRDTIAEVPILFPRIDKD